MTDLIDVAIEQDVAVITINRPDKLNALTGAMRRDLAAALREYGHGEPRGRPPGGGADGGGSGVRGIVLTGAGRAFCAGEDLREAAAQPAGGLIEEVELFHDITRAALSTRVPVVAAVNGIAVGGGSEITLCCDARIGSTAAEYYLPENKLGLTISNASSLLLPRLVGSRAIRLVLESPRLDARECLAAGLLDEVVEPAALIGTAVDLVRRWTRPGMATLAHLRLLRPPMDEVERAFARETEAARHVDETGIAMAGVGRFLDDRDRPR
jgi:enoyl-CoA hydratase